MAQAFLDVSGKWLYSPRQERKCIFVGEAGNKLYKVSHDQDPTTSMFRRQAPGSLRQKIGIARHPPRGSFCQLFRTLAFLEASRLGEHWPDQVLRTSARRSPTTGHTPAPVPRNRSSPTAKGILWTLTAARSSAGLRIGLAASSSASSMPTARRYSYHEAEARQKGDGARFIGDDGLDART